MRRTSAGAVTSNIRENMAFARFDFRRRKWLLPPFVRTILPVPVTRKRLAAALYVFILYFLVFAFGIFIPLTQYKSPFRRISVSGLWNTQKGRRLHCPANTAQCHRLIRLFQTAKAVLRTYFWMVTYLVPACVMVMDIVQPSSLGACSTSAISDSSAAISSSVCWPISG